LASYVGEEDAEIVRAMAETVHLRLSLVELPGASGTFVFGRDQSAYWPIYRPAEATPGRIIPAIPQSSTIVAFGIPDFDPIDAGWFASVDKRATLIWDRQGWLSRARDATAISRIPVSRRIFLANEEEAGDEFETSGADLGRVMPPQGFESAVIKKGADGCIVFTAGGTSTGEHVPAYPVDSKSTVGSGDVFMGAFAASLSLGLSTVPAVKRANAAASSYLSSDRDPFSENLLTSVERLTSR
jgi:hypothetical protein